MHYRLEEKNSSNEKYTNTKNIVNTNIDQSNQWSQHQLQRQQQRQQQQQQQQQQHHVPHHRTPHVTQVGQEVPLKLMKSQINNVYNNNDLSHTSQKIIGDNTRETMKGNSEQSLKPQQSESNVLPSITLSSSALNRRPLSDDDDLWSRNSVDDMEEDSTDPLDIQVTQHWEQITAEIWSALSTGSVPKLPVLPRNANDDADDDDDEGDSSDTSSSHSKREDLQKKRVEEFIKDATDGSKKTQGNFVKHLIDRDARCEIIFNLVKKEINNNINTSMLEIGSGSGKYIVHYCYSFIINIIISIYFLSKLFLLFSSTFYLLLLLFQLLHLLSTISFFLLQLGLSTINAPPSLITKSNGDPILDIVEGTSTSMKGEYNPFNKKKQSSSTSRNKKNQVRIQGCVSIRSAQAMPKTSVVYIGDSSSYSLYGTDFHSS